MSEEQQKLVTDNINLIFYYMKKNNIPIEEQDIGYIALCKAACTFDKSKGYKFTTYALICIRNEFGIDLRLKKRRPFNPVSLDESICNSQGKELTIEDTISQNYYTGISPSYTEVLSNLNEFLMSLSETHRSIYLKHLQGVVQKEIARDLNCSQAHVCRIIKQLQSKFIDKYYRGLATSEIINNIKEELYGKENRS